MYLKKVIMVVMSFFCFHMTVAQDLTTEQIERLEYKVDLFSTNDEELQALWYEDRMDQMKLEGKVREDYKKIVVYHAYKMEYLDNPTVKLSDEQIRRELSKQIEKLHKDVENIISHEQFEIHKKCWKAILSGVYQRKNWKLTN